MEERRRKLRNKILQTLLQGLKRDLSDVRNFSDVRIRFIPRQALLDAINQSNVALLLETLLGQLSYTVISIQDTAQYISPETGGCHCQKAHCTGARMILATLLFVGREELITNMFKLSGRNICDQDLPFGTGGVSNKHDGQKAPCESDQTTPWSLTRPQIHRNMIDMALFDQMYPSEKELFSFFQWQVMSAYLTCSNVHQNGGQEPDGISLPWQELTSGHVDGPIDGKFSAIQKVKIYSGNHDLVSHTLDFSRFPSVPQNIALFIQIADTKRERCLCVKNLRRDHCHRIDGREIPQRIDGSSQRTATQPYSSCLDGFHT